MAEEKPHRSKRETFWERIWASLLVLYGGVSAYLVWRTLSKYGVNAIVFLAIDMATSWPYGLATARIVVNVVKRRWHEVRRWAWVAGITFLAPYAYILASAHHAPRDVYGIVVLVIGALILLAILSIVLQIRSWGRLAVNQAQIGHVTDTP